MWYNVFVQFCVGYKSVRKDFIDKSGYAGKATIAWLPLLVSGENVIRRETAQRLIDAPKSDVMNDGWIDSVLLWIEPAFGAGLFVYSHSAASLNRTNRK